MPRLEELKESGDIADAADSIYMVYRPERHGNNIRYPDMTENWSEYDTHGTALLICYKNRNGAMTGEQMLGFNAATTKFYERDDFAKADGTMPPPITDILDTPF
jgi:replicative DNA helicase